MFASQEAKTDRAYYGSSTVKMLRGHVVGLGLEDKGLIGRPLVITVRFWKTRELRFNQHDEDVC